MKPLNNLTNQELLTQANQAREAFALYLEVNKNLAQKQRRPSDEVMADNELSSNLQAFNTEIQRRLNDTTTQHTTEETQQLRALKPLSEEITSLLEQISKLPLPSASSSASSSQLPAQQDNDKVAIEAAFDPNLLNQIPDADAIGLDGLVDDNSLSTSLALNADSTKESTKADAASDKTNSSGDSSSDNSGTESDDEADTNSRNYDTASDSKSAPPPPTTAAPGLSKKASAKSKLTTRALDRFLYRDFFQDLRKSIPKSHAEFFKDGVAECATSTQYSVNMHSRHPAQVTIEHAVSGKADPSSHAEDLMTSRDAMLQLLQTGLNKFTLDGTDPTALHKLTFLLVWSQGFSTPELPRNFQIKIEGGSNSGIYNIVEGKLHNDQMQALPFETGSEKIRQTYEAESDNLTNWLQNSADYGQRIDRVNQAWEYNFSQHLQASKQQTHAVKSKRRAMPAAASAGEHAQRDSRVLKRSVSHGRLFSADAGGNADNAMNSAQTGQPALLETDVTTAGGINAAAAAQGCSREADGVVDLGGRSRSTQMVK